MGKGFKIVRVSYGRTINTGNYESTRIQLDADCPEGNHLTTLKALEAESLVMEKKIKKAGVLS